MQAGRPAVLRAAALAVPAAILVLEAMANHPVIMARQALLVAALLVVVRAGHVEVDA